MEYNDYLIPPTYSDYPRHQRISEYFINYVNHFGFRKHIYFKTPGVHVEHQEDGTWLVKTGNGKRKHYDALAVSNGHHWSQRWPNPAFPGKFTGKIIHSHSYIDSKNPIKLIGNKLLTNRFPRKNLRTFKVTPIFLHSMQCNNLKGHYL